MTTATKHTHAFRLVTHIDGCHFYHSAYACECGATLSLYAERDVEADPYSAVWMEPVDDEPCDRCVELLGGAEPTHAEELIEP